MFLHTTVRDMIDHIMNIKSSRTLGGGGGGGESQDMSIIRMFGYCPCLLGEVIKFSINKRLGGKTWRVLNNEQ